MGLLKRDIPLLFSLIALIGTAQSHNILDASLEDFLNQVSIDDNKKTDFRVYYSKFLEYHNAEYQGKRRKKLMHLRSSALKTLKASNSEWYSLVEPYSLDLEESTQECRKVRLFLTRFGLLDAFNNNQPIRTVGTRLKVKNFFRSIGGSFRTCKNKIKKTFGKTKNKVKDIFVRS